MSISTTWSGASAICQLEWRPSRALGATLRVLGVLAAASIMASDLPSAGAWPLALAALAYGEWHARGYRGQPSRRLWWVAGRTPEIDGAPLQDARLHWRGPLAFLQGRDDDGRWLRLAWWPDTLSAASRRELRLVASVPVDRAATRSMAP